MLLKNDSKTLILFLSYLLFAQLNVGCADQKDFGIRENG